MPSHEPDLQELPWERVDAALRELLELDPAAQAAHLARLSPSEPALARRLARLLDASGRADALDSGQLFAEVAQTALREVGRSRSGTRLGAWQLHECIGAGGMAEVYRATRTIESGEQTAAIKVLHVPGADGGTDSIVREAQVLARLSDPRIARLFDCGRADRGDAWVAMEFVDGVPIDRWCAQLGASVRDRVRLMINVAMAVDHAHRNLVVHRDIKPGNVFVSQRDGGVKLLDFGIARALPGAGREATRTAMRAYTEAWASPEQIAGETVAVASDIYQLGELLYLLLAGQHPFEDASSNPVVQLAAMEAGPMPPSRRARAGADPARRRARQGSVDLDTIVLKAMEFRPERRYLSARDLADDLRRWLDGDAISARRGRLYRAGRLLRRHWGIAASLVLIAALLLGYVASLRDRERLLEAQRERTERILEVAVEVMDETDPYVAGATPAASDAAMRRIRARLHEDASADPEFRIRILNLLSAVHGRRGQVAVAIELREEAYALATAHRLDDALMAETAYALARALHSASRNDEAVAVLRAHERLIAAHAPLQSQALWARIESQEGDSAAARRRLERVVAGLGRNGSLGYDERAVFNQLAIVLGALGEHDASIAAAQRAFDGFEPQSGKEIASWVNYAMNLAVAYGDARRYREADALHRRISSWVEQHLGREHPQFAVVERSRAAGLVRVARYADALQVLEGAGASAARQQAPLHQAAFLQTRAIAAMYGGRAQQALLDLLEASALARRQLGTVANTRWRAEEQLAWLLFELGALAEASEVVQRIPRDGGAPMRRTAMLRILLAHSGSIVAEPAALAAEREIVAGSACLSSELAIIEQAIGATSGATRVTLPTRCDGPGGSLAAALGATWTPDWSADFPLLPAEPPLLARLRSAPSESDPFDATSRAAWERWREEH